MAHWHVAPLTNARAQTQTSQSRRAPTKSRLHNKGRPRPPTSLLTQSIQSEIPLGDLPPYSAMAPNLPNRSRTDEAIPDTDPSDTTALLQERLQAWKHMTAYLEDYIGEVAKDEKSSAKEKEKILKTVSHPLKEGHHFDQNLGGIAGLFENIRSNTQAQSNLHL